MSGRMLTPECSLANTKDHGEIFAPDLAVARHVDLIRLNDAGGFSFSLSISSRACARPSLEHGGCSDAVRLQRRRERPDVRSETYRRQMRCHCPVGKKMLCSVQASINSVGVSFS